MTLDMKLIMEGWRSFSDDDYVIEEGFKGMLGRARSGIQRRLGVEVVSGRITPYPAGEGNWLEISVPFSGADVENISDDVTLFVAIVDKVAEELRIKEPVITSGYRDAYRQASAMYDVWLSAKSGGKTGYLEKLYGEMCKSCSPGAGGVAAVIDNMFSTIADPDEAKRSAGDLISTNLISKHNTVPGQAIDYRVSGHPDVERVFQTVFSRGYVTGELIKEEDPPHWHITVDNIKPSGIKYLQWSNTPAMAAHYEIPDVVPGMMSEDLRYHRNHSVGVDKNIFRPGSSRFFKLFREVRHLHNVGLYTLNEEEDFLIKELDIGEYGIYEGELVPLDFPMLEDDSIDEAKYKGRKVKLGAKGAKRAEGGKAYVYVRDPKTKKVRRIKFGSSLPDAMGDSKAHRKRRISFGKRHNCAKKKDKTKPGYWACRATKMFGRSISGWW